MPKLSQTAIARTRAAVEGVFDTTVPSMVGMAVKYKDSGVWAVAFSLAAATICGSARWYAEITKNDPPLKDSIPRLQRIIRDRKAPLVITGLIQFGIATVAAFHSSNGKSDAAGNVDAVKKIMVPILFGMGNMIAAPTVVRKLFKEAATRTTSALKDVQNTSNAVLDSIFLRAETFWSFGLMCAGDSRWSTAVFAAALGLVVFQSSWEGYPDRQPPATGLSRVVNNPYTPLFLQTAGCAVAAIVYAHNGHIRDAVAMALYTFGFLTYAAEKKYTGVIECARAVLHRPSQPAPPKAFTAAGLK